MQNNRKNDLNEFELPSDDEQILMIAKYTYEHVKMMKEQEEK